MWIIILTLLGCTCWKESLMSIAFFLPFALSFTHNLGLTLDQFVVINLLFKITFMKRGFFSFHSCVDTPQQNFVIKHKHQHWLGYYYFNPIFHYFNPWLLLLLLFLFFYFFLLFLLHFVENQSITEFPLSLTFIHSF